MSPFISRKKKKREERRHEEGGKERSESTEKVGDGEWRGGEKAERGAGGGLGGGGGKKAEWRQGSDVQSARKIASGQSGDSP